MAYKVIWSPTAVDDLIAIGEYIERDSVFNARMVVSKFYDLSSRYGNHPRAGGIVSEIGSDLYRHRHVYGWRVIYRIDDIKAAVIIVAILHSRRQFVNIQGRFLE